MNPANSQYTGAESAAMEAALTAALAGPRGANPLVGAVILSRQGEQLATGYHRGAGTAHAEADAISEARRQGIDISGTSMVVTLEPCNHEGRTGPCAQALNLNREWFDAVAAKRPFVTLHIAQTLDSRIAAVDGTSQWISSPQSLADNHGLRELIDAILVGTGTVLIDNPRLTARTPDGNLSQRQPIRAVMGLREVPEDAAVRGTDDPAEALSTLFHQGVRHVMVEGGSSILSTFLAAELVDELIVYLAPTLLGSGTPALNDLGITTLTAAQQWSWDEAGGGAVRTLGNDLRLHLRPTRASHIKNSIPRREAAEYVTGGH
jgi:diaminohydroxyphosphoribosylaminopyrimidine deaminase/5-amino-6-(5-phosphoribosylamino)uracil reductase